LADGDGLSFKGDSFVTLPGVSDTSSLRAIKETAQPKVITQRPP